MTNKEESSFLQGVESRLDSLFGEDSGSPLREKDPVVPEPVVNDIPAQAEVTEDITADVTPELKEDIREIPIVKTPGFEPKEAAPEKIQSEDKSAFISEIEKRFSAIFGDDEKEATPVKAKETPIVIPDFEPPAQRDFAIEPPSIVMEEPLAERPVEPVAEIPAFMAAPAAESPITPEAPKREGGAISDFIAPVSSIFNSPLKDMKSIVLSIEWEISDQILEQFDEEVNKLYLLYTGNRIIQGFLRILRFLGRYIRVRGVSSNQDSINLLLSVYDHLESVMISEDMSEAKKHIVLIDNIKKYRAWVETTGLEAGPETAYRAPQFEEARMPVEEPVVRKEPDFEFPSLEIEPIKPIGESVSDTIPLRLQMEEKEEILFKTKEPDILFATEPAVPDYPVVSSEDQNTIMEAMKNMPPDEAVKYAVEEIKNIYQAELDALKEEIRMLKGSR